MHPKEAAYRGLIHNREKIVEKFNLDWIDHTPPSEHYPHRYKWDSGFFIEIYTDTAEYFLAERETAVQGAGSYAQMREEKRQAKARGYEVMAQHAIRRGIAESFSLFQGQHEDGMVPNVHFAPNGRGRDPERRRAFGLDAASSNYDQPNVTAVPILGLYELISRVKEEEPRLIHGDETLFLEEIYQPLKASLDFWDQVRTDERDKLTAVIHPHETGRDSDPTFDKFKPSRIARKGLATNRAVDLLNIPLDYEASLQLSVGVARAHGNLEKQKEQVWVKDVMMNCIYVDNLLAMAKLAKYAGRSSDASHYQELAETLQTQIIEKMYDKEDRIFYNIDVDDSKMKEVTINNLFGLILPNLPPEHLEAILDLMDNSFNTPYPLPSVATTSPNFDPHNREKQRLWRGPTWINTNAYLTDRGLLMQAGREDLPEDLRKRCQGWAERITISSWELLEKNGACEFYNPLSGEGQRLHVKNFGWSYKALTMKLLRELGLEDIALPNGADLAGAA